MQWRRYNDILNQIEHRRRERRVPVEAKMMEIELYHVTSMYVSHNLYETSKPCGSVLKHLYHRENCHSAPQ